MSTSLGSAVLELSADSSRLKGDVDSAGGAVQGALGRIATIAGGILTAQVFTKIADGFKNMVSSLVQGAMDDEVALAKLDAVLKSTGVAAQQQADAYAAAQGKFITTTAMSGEELGRLQGKLNDYNSELERTQDSLEAATARLQDMEAVYPTLEAPTASQTQALSAQREKVQELNAEVGDLTGKINETSAAMAAGGATIQISMVSALGLVPPVARMTRDELINMADALDNVTMFSDEATKSAEAILLTFTSIGAEVFPRAIEAAMDMSTVMGTDLNAATVMIGKALQDPIAGLTALRKVGVNFNDAAKTTIERMVAMGDVAGAQAFIMAELEKEFGGAARAVGETAAGQFAIAKENLSDLGESIVGAALPAVKDLLAAFNAWLTSPEIQAGVQQIIDWLSVNLPIAINWLLAAFQNVATFVQTVLVPAIQAYVLPVLQAIAGFIMTQVVPAVQAFLSNSEAVKAVLLVVGAVVVAALAPVLAIVAAVAAAVALVYTAWTQNWGGIQQIVANFVAAVGPAMQSIVTSIQTWLTGAAAFIQTNMAQIQAIFQTVWMAIQGTIEVTLAIIQGIIQVAAAVLRGDWEGAWTALRTMFEGIWNGMVTFLRGIGATLWGVLDLALKALGTNLQTQLGLIKGWFTTAWDDVVKWFEGIPQTFANIGANIVKGLLKGIQDTWNSVLEWIEQAVADLGAAAKAVLGISSPSQLFAGIGQNVSLGLAQGMASVPIPVPLPGQGGGGSSRTANYQPTYNIQANGLTAADFYELQRQDAARAAAFGG